jgi:SAM-dependent methyltransferase
LSIADRTKTASNATVPPRSLNFTGSIEGFTESADTLVRKLIELAGLEPSSRVLDVGCGLGRLAVPLTMYTDDRGSYDGLDIVESGIDWCNANIAPQRQNFHFTVADVFNQEYRPHGRYQASEYRFPFDDATFDLVVLVSVFTHLLPEDMTHYVSEINRVLGDGGRCFATYFLLNDESRRLMNEGRGSLRFKHRVGPHWLVTPKVPELGVAYEEPYVRDLFGDPFSEAAFYYGGWCGRRALWSEESGPGDQDIVVATTGAASPTVA